MLCEPSLKYDPKDLDIKKQLGIYKEKKGELEVGQVTSGVSRRESNDGMIGQAPQEFTKIALTNCGYLRRRKESVSVLGKGQSYLRLLEKSPSYTKHALETFYGKMRET